MLQGKKILLGVTGSIAAYKSAQIIRLLVKEGAEVKVIMTPLAKEFITPLTLATLARNPILVDFFDPTNGNWNSHVDLGLWADLFLIAPATANTMAKMANGIADNLLLTSYLSARAPVFVAPAMDLDMFSHPATQSNINKLKELGCVIIEPASGELASRLLAGLRAGIAAGGEAGPVHSAAVKVVDDYPWPVVDLRIDWAETDPLAALEQLWLAWEPQMDAYITRALDPREAPAYGVPGDE